MSKITSRQVYEAMTKICEENPERVNPQNDRAQCVYLSPQGERCLVGEFLLGLADLNGNRSAMEAFLRRHDAVGIDGLPYVNDLFEYDALEDLSDWQNGADSGYMWGQVLDRNRGISN